jgi:pyruvate/2-oxoglutarate dehydrogenase complex dihydrolipoamide acyltransferase (E2) component
MDAPVLMPQLGNEIEEAQITEWLKKVGDSVAAGEAIVSVTTPKVTLEVEAPASGKLKEIKVAVDELAKVGDTLAVIESA